MNYALYQVRESRLRDVAFQPYDPNRRVYADDYQRTYAGEIDGGTPTAMLETLFYKFNMNHPADFESYSLSMADIVVLGDGTYYCDTLGWQRLTEDAIVGQFEQVACKSS